MHEVDYEKIEQAVTMILEAIGEDPDREGLVDTPKRVAKMYAEMFEGLHKDPRDYFKTVFNENHDEVVLVKDIGFHSMCEHHLVPFLWTCPYRIYSTEMVLLLVLSKLARAVETTARRPQLQERITSTVADAMMEMLDPVGVFVVIEAEHMCMTMRGIRKPGAKTLTTVARGFMKHDDVKRSEILSLIKMS